MECQPPLCSLLLDELISRPMCYRHEQHQPHVGDGRFGVEKRLQRKGKNDRCPPANSLSAYPCTPGQNRQRGERSGQSRRETRCEIVFTKDTITCSLSPIGEGRFIQTKLIIEARNDVIAAFGHLSRRLRETRFVTVDQRQAPRASDVKKDATKKQQRVID